MDEINDSVADKENSKNLINSPVTHKVADKKDVDELKKGISTANVQITSTASEDVPVDNIDNNRESDSVNADISQTISNVNGNEASNTSFSNTDKKCKSGSLNVKSIQSVISANNDNNSNTLNVESTKDETKFTISNKKCDSNTVNIHSSQNDNSNSINIDSINGKISNDSFQHKTKRLFTIESDSGSDGESETPIVANKSPFKNAYAEENGKTLPVKHKSFRKVGLLTSDSEDEGNTNVVGENNEDKIGNENKPEQNMRETINSALPVKRKPCKKIGLLLSDSEDEDNTERLGENNEEKIQNENGPVQNALENINSAQPIKRKSFKKIGLLLSDSEDDDNTRGLADHNEQQMQNGNDLDRNMSESGDSAPPFKRKSFKKIGLLSSDSEDDNDTEKLLENNEKIEKNSVPIQSIFEDENEYLKQKKILSALCDSDTESEEENHESHHAKSNDHPEAVKSRKKTKAPKQQEKKMTAKEAELQKQEIQKESQRRTREACVSLPYHKPKPRSIREFLEKRPCLSSTLQNFTKSSPAVAIKMASKELEYVSKTLEEREKEVQKFYESESESDHEQNTECNKIENNERENDEPSQDLTSENSNINETSEQEANSVIEKCTLEVGNNEQNVPARELEDNLRQGSEEECLMEVNGNHDNNTACDNQDPEANERLLDEDENTTLEKHSVEQNEGEGEHETNCSNAMEIIDESENNEQINTTEEMCTTNNMQSHETNPKNDSTNSTVQNNLTEVENDSAEYTFNLDDAETEPTNSSNDNNTEQDELDRLINKYSEPVAKTQKEDTVPESTKKKMSKLELLKSLSNSKPKLSGRPDEVIDLSSSSPKADGVTKLMERFIKHASCNSTPREKIKLSVLSVAGGDIQKETLALPPEQEEPPVVNEKPGAKLQKLRGELINQMAQRRSELWQQRKQVNTEDGDKDGDNNEDEKSVCHSEDEILDDDEEAELTESEPESEDEENEDCIEEKKAKPKSAYLDDEAEESDEECEDEQEEQNEQECEEIVQENFESDDETSNGMEEAKKPLKRIIQKFADDSDDSQDVPVETQNDESENANRDAIDSTLSWDDNDAPPPHQKPSDRTPRRNLTQMKSDLGFLSPVINLTGLQNLNSGSKFLHESPVNVSPLIMTTEPSPLRDKRWHEGLQKKLFPETDDLPETQASISEAAALCSGTFATQNIITDTQDDNTQTQREELPSTQDLRDICSGKFTCTTEEPAKSISCENPTENDGAVSTEVNNEKSTEEVKFLDDEQDNNFISQLLDEEEMQQFKKKFDTPESEGSKNTSGLGRFLLESDEELDDENIVRKRKKKQKRLVFSDDEDSSEDAPPVDHNEEISLHDDDDESNMSDNVEGGDRHVEYDSEENEIEVFDEKEQEEEVPKPNDFFENEAELSESEWESEDEDENGLDALEFEQADNENFDENKMRTVLEKIHMRRLLDEDNREVKMLQEMLLEDGELHGTGRQRQFRWKNIDKDTEDEANKTDEPDVYIDEEECEEVWRRKRYERELFLKEEMRKSQQKNDDSEEVEQDSQIFKMGVAALRKAQNSSQINVSTEKSKPSTTSSPVTNGLFSSLKRGSFLARNDEVLARVAEFTKVSTEVVIGGAKKNFVFQTTESTTITTEKSSSVTDKKRKATDGTPRLLKKLRLNNLSSPMNKQAQKKTERAKQLFKF